MIQGIDLMVESKLLWCNPLKSKNDKLCALWSLPESLNITKLTKDIP